MSIFFIFLLVVLVVAAFGNFTIGRTKDAYMLAGGALAIVVVNWLGWWLLAIAGLAAVGAVVFLAWGAHLNRQDAIAAHNDKLAELGRGIIEGTVTEDYLTEVVTEQQYNLYR